MATDNLLHALQNGVIAGAALDVVEEEPLPASAPIVKAPNIIVTSHIAWYSSKSIGRLQRRVAGEALSVLPVTGFPQISLNSPNLSQLANQLV